MAATREAALDREVDGSSDGEHSIKKYAKAVLPFCNFVSHNHYHSGLEALEGAVGLFLPGVRDQDLRMLSGGMKHFFPFVGKTRISAD